MLQFTIHNSQSTMNEQVSVFKNTSVDRQIQPMKTVHCKLNIAIDRREIAV